MFMAQAIPSIVPACALSGLSTMVVVCPGSDGSDGGLGNFGGGSPTARGVGANAKDNMTTVVALMNEQIAR